MTDHEAFMASIIDRPADHSRRLIYADWLEEQGDPLCTYFRSPFPPCEYFLSGSGDGDGYGYGDGDGDGDGDGYGDGNGYGDGDGNGYGYGYGDGNGNGYGYGYGYGDGNGYGDSSKRKPSEGGLNVPTIGKRQLIVLPYGFVFCGDVVEQIGLFQFRVENASMIVRTGGTPWNDLARGEGRDSATFRKWGTITVGPNFGPSTEWAGELP